MKALWNGFWAWATTNSDGLKAVGTVLVAPVLAFVGWQIQSSLADRASIAETARLSISQDAADARALQDDQFTADQSRLEIQFRESLDAAEGQRSDRDRNAQYVGLAISILTPSDQTDGNNPVQVALRRYAAQILREMSPVPLPPELERALAEGRALLPTGSLILVPFNPGIDLNGAAIDSTVTRCSLSNPTACRFQAATE